MSSQPLDPHTPDASAGADRRARQRPATETRLRLVERYDESSVAEWAVAQTLASLPEQTWTVLHDVAWPGRPGRFLDHVAIGPTGVFVIDTRAWSGRVELDGDTLRHDGRRCDEVLRRVASAVLALAPGLDPAPSLIPVAVLCLASPCVVRGTVGGVEVTPRARLLDVLTARPVVLDPDEVRALVGQLDLRGPPADAAAAPASSPVSHVPPAPRTAWQVAAGRWGRGILHGLFVPNRASRPSDPATTA